MFATLTVQDPAIQEQAVQRRAMQRHHHIVTIGDLAAEAEARTSNASPDLRYVPEGMYSNSEGSSHRAYRYQIGSNYVPSWMTERC